MKYLLLVIAVLCFASVASAHGPQQFRRPSRRPVSVFSPFRLEQRHHNQPQAIIVRDQFGRQRLVYVN